MSTPYGFQATLRAKPGMGEEVLAILLQSLEPGRPAAGATCLAFVVSRSAADPPAFADYVLIAGRIVL